MNQKYKRRTKLFFISLALTAIFFQPTNTYAKKTLGDASGFLSQVSTGAGVEKTEVSNIIGNTINAVLQVTGLIFFGLLVLAGIRWMLARGNEESATKARNIMMGAVLGLIVIVSAYAISNFITRSIIQGQRQGTGTLEGGNIPGIGQTGCCLDQVGTGILADQGAGVWACRIDTLEGCERRANTEETGDTLIGPGTWEWYSGVELEACLKMCEDK